MTIRPLKRPEEWTKMGILVTDIAKRPGLDLGRGGGVTGIGKLDIAVDTVCCGGA